MKITVLAFYDRISLFHSLKPFLFYKHRRMFTFTRYPEYCLTRDTNKILFMDRWFQKPDHVDIELLKKLREKYHTIFFFNGNAGAALLRPEVLPYVDYFFNKSLYKDRSLYTKKFYGDELFADYYHTKHGINDPEPRTRAPLTDASLLKKVKLGWNIGIGDYPKKKFRQRSAVFLARIFGAKLVRPFHVHVAVPDRLPHNHGVDVVNARWGGPKRPTLLYHRNLMLEKSKGNPHFLSGRVHQNQYNKELKSSKIILSPFGWGEVCFRDFEAVVNGSLLLKPDMSHMETWPDIFVPYETYVPIDWDADDLVDTAEHYLANEKERLRIVSNAFDAYVDQARTIEDRLEAILNLIDK